MKYNLIKTDNYLLVVDDSYDALSYELPPIKNILSHFPLNNAPYLNGVPVLPSLNQEDDVEELASKHANLKSSIHDYDENYFNSHGVAIAKAFISGFNKSREKYKFTEEEVIAIVEKSRETGLTAEYLLLTDQFKNK